METNTVLLSLDDYNQLRDFRIEFERAISKSPVFGEVSLTKEMRPEGLIIQHDKMRKILSSMIDFFELKIDALSVDELKYWQNEFQKNMKDAVRNL